MYGQCSACDTLAARSSVLMSETSISYSYGKILPKGASRGISLYVPAEFTSGRSSVWACCRARAPCQDTAHLVTYRASRGQVCHRYDTVAKKRFLGVLVRKLLAYVAQVLVQHLKGRRSIFFTSSALEAETLLPGHRLVTGTGSLRAACCAPRDLAPRHRSAYAADGGHGKRRLLADVKLGNLTVSVRGQALAWSGCPPEAPQICLNPQRLEVWHAQSAERREGSTQAPL